MMRLILTALMMLAAPIASAITIDPPGSANAWDYWVEPGYAARYAVLFEALKSWVGASSYQSAVATMALAGFAVTAFKSFRNTPERLMLFFVGIWLASYAAFSLKMDLVITDRANISTQLVTDVPAAVALPAVIASSFGQWSTESVEENYSFADENLMKSGALMGMSQKIMADLATATIDAPWLRLSIDNYIAECAMPRIYSGALNQDTILNSPVLWDALEVTNQVSMTEIMAPDGTRTIETCHTAWTTVGGWMNSYAPTLLSKVKGNYADFYSASGAGGAFLDTAMNSVLQNAAVTETPAKTALQAGIIQILKGSYKNMASLAGVDEASLAINSEQASSAQRAGWYTAAKMMIESAPYLQPIMKLLLLGVFPLILASTMLGAAGAKMLINWVKYYVVVILLEPGFGILNFISVSMMNNNLSPIINNGITLKNAGEVINHADNSAILTSFFAITILPMVITTLVSGGTNAITAAMSGASGGGQASGAAGKAALGGFDSGNINVGNTKAHSRDLTHSLSYGYKPDEIHQSAAGSTLTYNHQGGQMTTLDGVNQTRQTSVQNTAAIQSAISQRRGEHNKISDSTSLAVQSAYSEAKERATASLLNEQGGEQRSRSKEEVDQIAATQAFEAVYTASRRAGMSHDQAMNAGVVGALGTGKGGGPSLKGKEDSWWKSMVGKVKGGLLDLAGISARMEAKFTDKDAVTHNQENNAATSNKDGSSRNQSVSNKHGEGHTWQRTGGHSESGNDATRFLTTDTSTHLRASAKEWTESREKLDSLNQQLTAAESQTVTRGLRLDEIQQTLDKAGAITGQVETAIKNGSSELAGNRKGAEQVTNGIAQGTQNINSNGDQVTQAVKDNHDVAERREVNGLIEASQHVTDKDKLQHGMIADAARNNDRSYQQYADLLKKQEDMDRDKEVAYAAFGAVYGFDKGGVIGAVAGTAIAGGTVFLSNHIGGGSDGKQELHGAQMDAAGLELRDIDLGNGKTAQIAGFVLSDGGQAHAMYFVEGEGFSFMGYNGEFVHVNGEGTPQVSGGAINSVTPMHLDMHPEKKES